jgi:hypothetical protein
MAKWFTVTIDTEGDRACPFFVRKWGHLTGRFSSVLEGIPRLRSIWEDFAVLPVYLATDGVLSCPDCVEVLKQEQKAGAEVGTHLHIGDEFPCNVPQERQHLEQLTNLYMQAFGTRPCSYRAGRYGMSDNTLTSLAELGYKVDSSVTPHVDWSAQGGPDYQLRSNRPYWQGGILEVPITILGARKWWPFGGWSRYRWLRPSVATAEHLRSIVDRACQIGIQVLNMTFHTMELIPRASPYVRTQVETVLYLRRIEKTVAYMIKQGFEATTLSGLHDKWDRRDPRGDKVLENTQKQEE